MDPDTTVLVSEAFISLQGEGKLTGVPSWFLRLSGCNLRCRWCDTPYASWKPEGERQTISWIVDRAHDLGVRHVVLTGGEPMIFRQLPAICDALRDLGMHITIETAGTVFDEGWADLPCDLMSISPKLANSTPVGDPRDPLAVWSERHESRRLNVAVLHRLLEHFPNRQFKFVVSALPDLEEIDTLLGQLPELDAEDVMLMPEGTASPVPGRVQWVVDTCLRRGWRYCHRLHIELFGDTRGT